MGWRAGHARTLGLSIRVVNCAPDRWQRSRQRVGHRCGKDSGNGLPTLVAEVGQADGQLCRIDVTFREMRSKTPHRK